MATKLVQSVVDVSFGSIGGATQVVNALIDGASRQPLKTLSEADFELGVSSVQIHCEDEAHVKEIVGDITYYLATNGGVVNFGQSAV